jgi:hypothetical protein
MFGRDGVPNSRQHVGNRISHSLQLHFRLPIANCRLKEPIGNRQSEIGNASPTGFHDTGDLSRQRQFTKTNSAQVKFSQIRTRAAAPLTTGIAPHRKFWLAISFRDQ